MITNGCGSVTTSTVSLNVGGTVTDIEGNVYHTVVIGTQEWMAENLKTKTYNNGTAIPLVTDFTTWGTLSTPGYCWYSNDSVSNKTTYGALYNWYAVNTGHLAPTGWHVPSDAEWTILANYLGSGAGGKLKETGTAHWVTPNTGATNVTGFSALPGGSRGSIYGTFNYVGNEGLWWSSTVYDGTSSLFCWIWHDDASLFSSSSTNFGYGKAYGMSVRCLRD
jgi:uncharacterized protein (TIGR02145 family)